MCNRWTPIDVMTEHRVLRSIPLSAVMLCSLLSAAATVCGKSGSFTWGMNAITLQSISIPSPTPSAIINASSAVSLNRFYRTGGIPIPATPTRCCITYNRTTLFVVFRCTENDMRFASIRHHSNWRTLRLSPVEQDSDFPDKVDLFIQPVMNHRIYFHFLATIHGRSFACRYRLTLSKRGGTRRRPRIRQITDFHASVTRATDHWTVLFRIPWKSLGGKPDSYFGLLPIRTRWRDGQVSSPVAYGSSEAPPTDLFIETHLHAGPGVRHAHQSLCRLPSGVLRWQWPTLLVYPDAAVRHQIWRMEQNLDQPTNRRNFPIRLQLTQYWIDLLTMEGFNFRAGNGSIAEKGMVPHTVRRRINAALRHGHLHRAYRLLDIFLRKLNATSRDWFADGSPGDQLRTRWISVSKLTAVESAGNVLLMHAVAGTHDIHLHLSLPTTGGIRIYADHAGYFTPAHLLPLHVTALPDAEIVRTAEGSIDIHRTPFTITYDRSDGRRMELLGADDLAFRFGVGGKVLDVDFRHRLGAHEILYGFGERYDHFNEHGRVLTLWDTDDWYGDTVGLMNETYKPIPILQSSKGLMIFDNSSYRLRADIGKTIPGQYRLTQQGPIFDYYFWIGPPEKSLQSYTALTGRPILPPKWAFGPWIGRTGIGWSQGPLHNAVADEERVVKHFEKLDIVHSAIYAEGSSADSAALNRFMAARGIKVLSWFYPVVGRAEQARLLPGIPSDQLPVLRSKSNDVPWPMVDFTNPNAFPLMQRWWKHRLNIGVAGSMVDFGDRVPEDAEFYDGESGAEMHNFYAYDYDKTINKVFRQKRGGNFILFARAAAPGTQKWVAQFAGDHPANFAGLKAVLTGALNLSACGFSTWGSDLGGFLGWPEPTVYMRWTQFACFSPLMRCHGRTPREPWHYGPAAVTNYKYYTWVRENLLNYIYNAAAYAHQTGIPMMRSLAVAFPGEPGLAAVSDEYMFGDDLLVAPVITADNNRIIHIPAGRWTNLWNGTVVTGPAAETMHVPADQIPVYMKQGTVMPVQLNPSLQFGRSLTRGGVNALILTPPATNHIVNLLNSRMPEAQVISHPSRNRLSIALNHFPKTSVLLLYNVYPSAVRLNGKLLPKLTGKHFGSEAAGWRTERSDHRVVIRLPAGGAGHDRVELQYQGRDRTP